MTEKWRMLNPADRNQFLDWVCHEMRERQKLGHKVYGDTFQGKPLDHAIAEALDLVFYLWEEKRRQVELGIEA